MCLLFGKLSKATTATLIIGRLPIANHFGNIKPLFSVKNSNLNKITLVEKDLKLEKNDDIAETLNDFFTSVVSKLNILRYQDLLIDSDQTENGVGHPILRIIEQYKNRY